MIYSQRHSTRSGRFHLPLVLCLAGALAFAPALAQEPAAAATRFASANSQLREAVKNLINQAGKSRGHEVDESALMISSLADNLIVAGAPVKGVKDLALATRGGNDGEKKDVPIGLLLVAGAGGDFAQAGSQKRDPREVGGVPTGVFRVMGRMQGNERLIAIVGDDGKVITHVKIDPKWGTSREDFWRPVYMSILNSWMPMLGQR